jgi:hypothetical protein
MANEENVNFWAQQRESGQGFTYETDLLSGEDLDAGNSSQFTNSNSYLYAALQLHQMRGDDNRVIEGIMARARSQGIDLETMRSPADIARLNLTDAEKRELFSETRDYIGWFQNNVAGAGLIGMRVNSDEVTPEQRRAFLYMLHVDEHTSMWSWDQAGRFAVQGILTDPTTIAAGVAAFFTLGTGGAAVQGARLAGQRAVVEGIERVVTTGITRSVASGVSQRIASRAAGEAVEGGIRRAVTDGFVRYAASRGTWGSAAFGAADAFNYNFQRQGVEVSTNFRESYSLVEGGISALTGAGASFVLGAGFNFAGTALGHYRPLSSITNHIRGMETNWITSTAREGSETFQTWMSRQSPEYQTAFNSRTQVYRDAAEARFGRGESVGNLREGVVARGASPAPAAQPAPAAAATTAPDVAPTAPRPAGRDRTAEMIRDLEQGSPNIFNRPGRGRRDSFGMDDYGMPRHDKDILGISDEAGDGLPRDRSTGSGTPDPENRAVVRAGDDVDAHTRQDGADDANARNADDEADTNFRDHADADPHVNTRARFDEVMNAHLGGIFGEDGFFKRWDRLIDGLQDLRTRAADGSMHPYAAQIEVQRLREGLAPYLDDYEAELGVLSHGLHENMVRRRAGPAFSSPDELALTQSMQDTIDSIDHMRTSFRSTREYLDEAFEAGFGSVDEITAKIDRVMQVMEDGRRIQETGSILPDTPAGSVGGHELLRRAGGSPASSRPAGGPSAAAGGGAGGPPPDDINWSDLGAFFGKRRPSGAPIDPLNWPPRASDFRGDPRNTLGLPNNPYLKIPNLPPFMQPFAFRDVAAYTHRILGNVDSFNLPHGTSSFRALRDGFMVNKADGSGAIAIRSGDLFNRTGGGGNGEGLLMLDRIRLSAGRMYKTENPNENQVTAAIGRNIESLINSAKANCAERGIPYEGIVQQHVENEIIRRLHRGVMNIGENSVGMSGSGGLPTTLKDLLNGATINLPNTGAPVSLHGGAGNVGLPNLAGADGLRHRIHDQVFGFQGEIGKEPIARVYLESYRRGTVWLENPGLMRDELYGVQGFMRDTPEHKGLFVRTMGRMTGLKYNAGTPDPKTGFRNYTLDTANNGFGQRVSRIATNGLKGAGISAGVGVGLIGVGEGIEELGRANNSAFWMHTGDFIGDTGRYTVEVVPMGFAFLNPINATAWVASGGKWSVGALGGWVAEGEMGGMRWGYNDNFGMNPNVDARREEEELNEQEQELAREADPESGRHSSPEDFAARWTSIERTRGAQIALEDAKNAARQRVAEAQAPFDAAQSTLTRLEREKRQAERSNDPAEIERANRAYTDFNAQTVMPARNALLLAQQALSEAEEEITSNQRAVAAAHDARARDAIEFLTNDIQDTTEKRNTQDVLRAMWENGRRTVPPIDLMLRNGENYPFLQAANAIARNPESFDDNYRLTSVGRAAAAQAVAAGAAQSAAAHPNDVPAPAGAATTPTPAGAATTPNPAAGGAGQTQTPDPAGSTTTTPPAGGGSMIPNSPNAGGQLSQGFSQLGRGIYGNTGWLGDEPGGIVDGVGNVLQGGAGMIGNLFNDLRHGHIRNGNRILGIGGGIIGGLIGVNIIKSMMPNWLKNIPGVGLLIFAAIFLNLGGLISDTVGANQPGARQDNEGADGTSGPVTGTTSGTTLTQGTGNFAPLTLHAANNAEVQIQATDLDGDGIFAIQSASTGSAAGFVALEVLNTQAATSALADAGSNVIHIPREEFERSKRFESITADRVGSTSSTLRDGDADHANDNEAEQIVLRSTGTDGQVFVIDAATLAGGPGEEDRPRHNHRFVPTTDAPAPAPE